MQRRRIVSTAIRIILESQRSKNSSKLHITDLPHTKQKDGSRRIVLKIAEGFGALRHCLENASVKRLPVSYELFLQRQSWQVQNCFATTLVIMLQNLPCRRKAYETGIRGWVAPSEATSELTRTERRLGTWLQL